MPRPGQVRAETDERLSDRIAVGLIMRSFPPELVDRVVAECGRAGQRNRLLPPWVVVYFVLAMCLFPHRGYQDVARLLSQGLAWARFWSGRWQVPTTAAISRARVRLGPEPLKALFAQVTEDVAAGRTPGARYRCWRPVSLDGTAFEMPDSEENTARFGCPQPDPAGRRPFPQVRVMALAECGTQTITAATLGPKPACETTLSRELVGRLGERDLLLAGNAVLSLELWRTASARGADLLWRTFSHAVARRRTGLPDGSYLTDLVQDHRKRADRVVVRVVESASLGPGGPVSQAPYRLITTILDHEAAPAAELAALFERRWEIERALGVLRTHRRAPVPVLRSRWPGGVEQEVWGHLLLHHAIRASILP